MDESQPLKGGRGIRDETDSKKKRQYIIIGIVIFLLVAIAIAVTLAVVLKKKEQTNDLKIRLSAISSSLLTQTSYVTSFWNAYGPDNVNANISEPSGFYGTLNMTGGSIFPTNKTLLQISQHLYAYSSLARFQNNAQYIPIAQDLYGFLTYAFYQVGAFDNGEFFYLVDRPGANVLDFSYKLYAQTFTLDALAQYQLASQDTTVDEYFEELFADMDTNSHDDTYGGYNTTFDPSGNPYPVVYKDVYTHLALLQGLNNIYEADPNEGDNPELIPRMEEIYNLFEDYFFQAPNYLHDIFNQDWSPAGTVVRYYGTELEAVWIIQQTGSYLSLSSDANAFVQKFGVPASDQGYDSVNGGYFNSGNPNGGVIDNTKKLSSSSKFSFRKLGFIPYYWKSNLFRSY